MRKGPPVLKKRYLTVFVAAFVGGSYAASANPCVSEYPSTATEVAISPWGTVARIEPVEWFEDGVYRIALESGDVIITQTDDRPALPVGATLERRIYMQMNDQQDVAGCYCQTGTDVCVEEYSYP